MFIVLFLLSGEVFSQSKIGSIETNTGEEIDIYSRSIATENRRFLDKTCDCLVRDYTDLVYVSETGNVTIIDLSDLKRVRLNIGTRYCTSFNTDLVKKFKIKKECEFSSLHWGDGTEFYSLYTTIFENENYQISVEEDNIELGQFVIHDKKTRQEAFNNNCYIFKVGVGKKGDKALEKIQEYFSDCPAFISSIDKKVKYNEKVSKLKRKSLLADLPAQCN